MKQHIKTLIAGGVLALVLIGMAMRGPLEDGYAAYQRGDYAKVMRLFRPLADQGKRHSAEQPRRDVPRR